MIMDSMWMDVNVYDVNVWKPTTLSRSTAIIVMKAYLEYGQSTVCARITIKDF